MKKEQQEKARPKIKNKIKNIFKSIGIILLLLCFNSVMFSIFNINLKSLSEKEYLIYTVLFELVLLIIFIIIYRKTLSKNGKEYFKNFLWWLTEKRMLINKRTGTMHYYHS